MKQKETSPDLLACMSGRVNQNALFGMGPLKLLTRMLLLYSASNNKLAEKGAKLLGGLQIIL